MGQLSGEMHLARTLAPQSGMTNQWLKELGLVSVRDIWIKVQGYANIEPAPYLARNLYHPGDILSGTTSRPEAICCKR